MRASGSGELIRRDSGVEPEQATKPAQRDTERHREPILVLIVQGAIEDALDPAAKYCGVC